MCNEQPKNTKQLITNTLNPKTMGKVWEPQTSQIHTSANLQLLQPNQLLNNQINSIFICNYVFKNL